MAKLKLKLPENRTYYQILNHYEIEKKISASLKESSREGRKIKYKTMYDELFSSVPDHPRLLKRKDVRDVEMNNVDKWEFFKKFIFRECDVVEFAAGDCGFSYYISSRCKNITGVDISDQREKSNSKISNFQLIIYDGIDLNIKDCTADCCISDQLIEHIHPKDLSVHLTHAYNILKYGGVYVLRTPHKFAGPHDISKFFSDVPEGFHLHEYSFNELVTILKRQGFSKIDIFLRFNRKYFTVFPLFVSVIESLFRIIPVRLRRIVCGRVFNSIAIASWK